MKENEIKAFVRVITEYFETISGVPAAMGLPYIKGEDTEMYDYTGIIGISGNRRGGVYFTAPKELLQDFGFHILGDSDLDDASLFDLVGEITNTIAGNMREVFGASFLISVPIVMRGKIDAINMKLKPPVFIIPIEWQGFRSHLAIGLE